MEIKILKELNHTNLVLIPKVTHPKFIDQFRPIGLCNFHYKAIARITTNRICPIVANIIDESQSAFILGRLITDNVLIAHGIMHFLRMKKKGKDTLMAMKLDMYKAYDRIEWSFVRKILLALGFSKKVDTSDYGMYYYNNIFNSN